MREEALVSQILYLFLSLCLPYNFNFLPCTVLFYLIKSNQITVMQSPPATAADDAMCPRPHVTPRRRRRILHPQRPSSRQFNSSYVF